jgi:hypothetical protein
VTTRLSTLTSFDGASYLQSRRLDNRSYQRRNPCELFCPILVKSSGTCHVSSRGICRADGMSGRRDFCLIESVTVAALLSIDWFLTRFVATVVQKLVNIGTINAQTWQDESQGFKTPAVPSGWVWNSDRKQRYPLELLQWWHSQSSRVGRDGKKQSIKIYACGVDR